MAKPLANRPTGTYGDELSNAMEPISQHTWHKRAQVSVRVLLILVLVAGSCLGWVVRSASIQREVVAAIEKTGSLVMYDWQFKNGHPVANGAPRAPKWLVDFVGVDYFGHVTCIVCSCKISDAEMFHIGHLAHLEHLEFACVDTVSDAGLAHIEGLTALKVLCLKSNKVTDAGLTHLGHLTGLRRLWLRSNAITNRGLDHLNGLRGLQNLGLEGSSVSQSGVRELQLAVRGLNVSW
jgi:hypothetical protein